MSRKVCVNVEVNVKEREKGHLSHETINVFTYLRSSAGVEATRKRQSGTSLLKETGSGVSLVSPTENHSSICMSSLYSSHSRVPHQ